jgi:hypothetical protein
VVQELWGRLDNRLSPLLRLMPARESERDCRRPHLRLMPAGESERGCTRWRVHSQAT